MLDLTGQMLDRFQIATRLGDEHWGTAWKAYDPKLDRTVALLTLDPTWAGQEHHGEYAMNTARVVLRFRHPGVARILDLGQSGGIDYLVQEYIPGHNLETILRGFRERGACLSIIEAVQVVIEICRALDYVHQRNLVHGNITPAAILFRDEPSEDLLYQPVLLYLGMLNPEAPGALPAMPYRAPELDRGGQIGPAADIFTLGVLLFELLTGMAPQSYPFPRPASLRPEIPDGLEKLLRKALTPDPANRFSDPGRMAAALEGILPLLAAALNDPGAPAPASPGESLLAALRAAWQEPVFAPFSPSATQKAAAPGDTQPAAPPQDLSHDQVHILEPGKEIRSIHLRPGAIIIGRGRTCDIIINTPNVSRRHARLEFDGQDYRITDLNSTNGTYLDEEALIPDEPTVWPVDQGLRISDVWLRLERAGQPGIGRAFWAEPTRTEKDMPRTVPVVTTAAGRSVRDAQITRSADGLIGVYIENPNLVAKPGGSVTFTLTLFNRSAAADTFNIAFDGLPVQWMGSPAQPVSLPASSDRELTLTIRPPRTPAGRAGRHQLIAHVTSLRAPEQKVDLHMSVTVSAYSEFFSELQVNQARNRQVGQVLVHNRGNQPETFMILWEDRQNEMLFDPPQVRVTIPPGQSAVVEYKPQLYQPRWFGSDTLYKYKVHVSAQTGEMRTHTGEYMARPLIPTWAPIAVMAICVGLACLVALLAFDVNAPDLAASQTSESKTATVVRGTRVAEAATGTVIALSGDLTATQRAVSETALAENADTDGDRLSKVLENLHHTDPTKPDSDGDGLNDGEEILDHFTNPLTPDSDNDELRDGDEVDKGSNPLNKDTDGDGVLDGADPDPLKWPTPTLPLAPTLTHTPTVTPTSAPQFTDLTIAITNGRDAATPGEAVSYRIDVTNKGAAELRDVAVTAALPAGLVNATWTCAAGVGSRCTTENGLGNVTARLNLAAQGSATITLDATVSPDAANQIAVVANVAAPAGQIDTNPVNNQATDRDTLSARVVLTLTNTDNRDAIRPGETNTYILTVRNTGPSTVNGVNLIDAFPAELGGVSWTCAASPGSSCSTNGPAPGNVNTLLNLAPGGSVTVTATGVVQSGITGTIANTASITSPIDPLANNKTVTDTTQIQALADLGLSVTAPISVSVSSLLTYTLRITNDGPSTGNGLSLAAQIPLDAGFITHTLSSPATQPVCNPSLGRVHCTLGALPAGGNVQMQLVLRTPPSAGLLNTIWDLLANEPDPNELNNRVESTVQVQ